MTAGNPGAGSLFRSLGADDSYFETRARAASKEAEQRWPLFKAVAPTKAQETPELSAQQRQATWTPPPIAAQAAKAPRLSRPGLGQKLASGLRELSQKTKQEVATPSAAEKPAAPMARGLRGTPPSAATPPRPPVATSTERSTAPVAPPFLRSTAATIPQPTTVADATVQIQPRRASPSKLLGEAPTTARPAAAARKKAAPGGAASAAPLATGTPTEVPRAPAKKGLFSQLALAPAHSADDAAPATTTPLQGVFARLNAGSTAPEAATNRKRGSLFGRMGR